MKTPERTVGLTRRSFVFSLGALAAPPPRFLRAGAQGGKSPGRTALSADERDTLDAICEQIFPKDEYPGARDLGVVRFIETTLLTAHPDWIRVYHAGLRAVDQSCRALHGCAFRELPADGQIRFLRSMEEAALTSSAWREMRPADFFGLVRDHTFKGAYSHPRYGGNRDKGAWKMIGYRDWWAE